MRYAFQTFLLLYPAPYRNLFGREMASVFEQAADEYQPRGFFAYCAFLCCEFLGLIAGAFSARSDEYLTRTRCRMTAPFVLSLVAGTAIAALTQSCFVSQVGRIARRLPVNAPAPDTYQIAPDVMGLLLMATGILFFVSLLAVAFVWNMRTVGIRAGRLKPIWMPGRAADARTTRRDQALRRNSGGQRRELYRRGR